MHAFEQPTTLVLLTCSDVRPGAGNLIDLLGVFENVAAPAVPVELARLCVYWTATGLRPGRWAFGIALTDADDIPVPGIPPARLVVEGVGVRDVVRRFERVRFPAHGEYRVQITHDGVAVAERRLSVVPAARPTATP
jgi:hypothetical protein